MPEPHTAEITQKTSRPKSASWMRSIRPETTANSPRACRQLHKRLNTRRTFRTGIRRKSTATATGRFSAPGRAALEEKKGLSGLRTGRALLFFLAGASSSAGRAAFQPLFISFHRLVPDGEKCVNCCWDEPPRRKIHQR